MEKAYDRMNWSFLIAVMRKMGFPEIWNDQVWRIISNCWFSVLINGKKCGFFKSTRGLRQGDPLSPSLFILAAEALSRSLNSLVGMKGFRVFHKPPSCPSLTHLAFADDLILFSSGDLKSLDMLSRKIKQYEEASGQLVNKSKSCFIVSSSISTTVQQSIGQQSGFKEAKFPINFLGCPLFAGRRKRSYFDSMVDKVSARINRWSNQYLSYGGRIVLIKNVLQSLPVYTMAALAPPISVLNDIERLCSNFLWGMKEEGTRFHWISWSACCQPVQEGGLGFRRLRDVCDSLACKLWWRFRSTTSLWKNYLQAKYCTNDHPRLVSSHRRFSLPWRRMLSARDFAEPCIRWLVGRGEIDLHLDNWSGVDLKDAATHFRMKVSDLQINGCIDPMMCNYFLPNHVIGKAQTLQLMEMDDRAVWSLTSSGEFSVKTAWERIRESTQKTEEMTALYHQIWETNIPLKISFFGWRLIQGRIPTDEVLSRFFGICGPSACFCCSVPSAADSIEHLFLNSDLAKASWKFFGDCFKVDLTITSIKRMLRAWQIKRRDSMDSRLIKSIPLFIIWEIWKARNVNKYEGRLLPISKVIDAVKVHIQGAFRTDAVLLSWDETLSLILKGSRWQKIQIVHWKFPPDPFLKLNTDGAVNSDGQGGGGGVCRNSTGKLLFGFHAYLGHVSVLEAEATSLLYGLKMCVTRKHSQVILETDSLLLCKMLNGQARIPWTMFYLVNQIQQLRRQGEFPVVHCFREVNSAADYLAKEALRDKQTTYFMDIRQMTSDFLGHLRTQNVPHIRVREKDLAR